MNREFAKALGHAVRRPSFMPAPGFALRLLLGEMADGLLLSGQRAVPAKAQTLGFTFKYENLDTALANLFGTP
jgi:NAD dependent epimerase/dehydratase family enzyme